MDGLFELILNYVSGINPLYAVLLAALWLVFGEKIKTALAALLSRLKRQPDADPAPADGSDLDEWLEQHPLLDRLWQRLKDRVKDAADGTIDEDDLYLEILKALRNK